jgi:hypothetical protein
MKRGRAMSLISDIFEINRRLSYDLWHLKSIKDKPHELSPRLIIPENRKSEERISEQEAKTIYCGILNKLNYYYSIETPTEETYMQKGKTPQSASTDLSLYSFDYDKCKLVKRVNVEFKHDSVQVETIRKDIEKLIREKITGNWIHTKKSINSSSLSILFDKFIQSFAICKQRKYLINLNNNGKVEEISIVFYFHCIQERWACIKHFKYSGLKYDDIEDDFMKYVNDFFKIDYKISRDATKTLVEVDKTKTNGWLILSQNEYHKQIT